MKNAIHTMRESIEGIAKKNPTQNSIVPRYIEWRIHEYTPLLICVGSLSFLENTALCDFVNKYLARPSEATAKGILKMRETNKITVECLETNELNESKIHTAKNKQIIASCILSHFGCSAPKPGICLSCINIESPTMEMPVVNPSFLF
jgi:hypothetical protein